MEVNRERIQTLAWSIFHSQLLNVYRTFELSEDVYLSKETVLHELNKRKKKEDKLEKMKKFPLIGKMIPRYIPGGYCGSSSESKFILSIMNNLGVDYLDSKIVKDIWHNQKEFYLKHYRKSYEKEREIRLKMYESQDMEKDI